MNDARGPRGRRSWRDGAASATPRVVERLATIGGRRWRYLSAEPERGGGGPAGSAGAGAPGRGLPGRPAVLCVHGAGGYADKWRLQLPALAAAGFRAVAPDLPGHRGSQGPGLDTIDGYRDALAEFAAAVLTEPFALAGHSMGGAIAQSFALRAPERLAALVLVGTGARLRVHPNTLDRFASGAVDRDFLAAGFGVRPDPALLDAEAEGLAHTPPPVRHGDFLACDRFDALEAVAGIAVPTLVLVGREDRMTPVRYSTFLAERIPGARLHVIDGAGHYVMLERPVETSAALIEFLADLPARPAHG